MIGRFHWSITKTITISVISELAADERIEDSEKSLGVDVEAVDRVALRARLVIGLPEALEVVEQLVADAGRAVVAEPVVGHLAQQRQHVVADLEREPQTRQRQHLADLGLGDQPDEEIGEEILRRAAGQDFVGQRRDDRRLKRRQRQRHPDHQKEAENQLEVATEV